MDAFHEVNVPELCFQVSFGEPSDPSKRVLVDPTSEGSQEGEGTASPPAACTALRLAGEDLPLCAYRE